MLVSVIIPAYNRENTIKDAVESILQQTYSNLEVIIVDDCSKDNTVQVAKSINDSRVSVICSEKNGGACVARNTGIDNAKGDIIAFQDSDDEWHKDKLEKCLKALEEQKADFVFSAVNRIGEGGYANNCRVVPTYNLNNESNKLRKILYLNCVSTQTIVAKKEVFDVVRFDPEMPRFQDWDLSIQVIAKGFKVFYIDEPLVDCYIQDNSITGDMKKAAKAIRLLEKKNKELLKKDRVAYHEFYYRAAFWVEDAGENGAEYFYKAYRSKKSVAGYIRYAMSKFRIYGVYSKVRDKLIKRKL